MTPAKFIFTGRARISFLLVCILLSPLTHYFPLKGKILYLYIESNVTLWILTFSRPPAYYCTDLMRFLCKRENFLGSVKVVHCKYPQNDAIIFRKLLLFFQAIIFGIFFNWKRVNAVIQYSHSLSPLFIVG